MFKFLGHNCFRFETKGEILITDPWFSNKGGFFGSWFQYPKNHHLLNSVIEDSFSQKKFFVFLRHEHQDHFDLDSIKKFSKKTTFLIPDFSDSFLLQQLKKLNFSLITLKHFKKLDISSNLYVRAIISDIGINHDCALIIQTKKFCFLNQNDCKVFDILAQIPEKINFYSVQFSGATWHPSNFILPLKQKNKIGRIKVLNKLNNVLNGNQILKPDYFIPAAGPAIFPFLDEGLSKGVDNIFIHQDELNRFLSDKGIKNAIYLNPGDEFSDKNIEPIKPPSTEEIIEYRKSVTNVWSELDVEFSNAALENLIVNKLNKIKDISFEKSPIIVFKWGELSKERIIIDLNKKQLEDTYDGDYIEIFAEKKYFALMHSGHRWQDIILSLRAKVTRNPDIFSNTANIFLFSDLGNIRDAFLSTVNISKERIKIMNNAGEVVEINKFCPHQGANLCEAPVDNNNILKCPRHGWEFDLNNHGINIKSGKSINLKKLTVSKN